MNKKIIFYLSALSISALAGANVSNLSPNSLNTNSENNNCTLNIHCNDCNVVDSAGETYIDFSNSYDSGTSLSFTIKKLHSSSIDTTLQSSIKSFKVEGSESEEYEYVLDDNGKSASLSFTITADTIIDIDTNNPCAIFKVSTTSADETVGFSYNGAISSVDWGDGTVNNETTHTYTETNKTYETKINGNCRSIRFANLNSESNGFSLLAEGNKDITEINLIKDIKNIGQGSFANLSKLETITIPSDITNISLRSFSGDNALKTINLEDNEKYEVVDSAIIEKDTSGTNNTLIYSNIVLDFEANNVTKIADYAFENSGLNHLSIDNNVTNIGNYAFNNCESLEYLDMTKYTVSDNPPSIGTSAFSGCSKLSAIKFVSTDVKTKFANDSSWGEYTEEFNVSGCTAFEIIPIADADMYILCKGTPTVTPSFQYCISTNGEDSEWHSFTTPTTSSEEIKFATVYQSQNQTVKIMAHSENKSLGSSTTIYYQFYPKQINTTKMIKFDVKGHLTSLLSTEYCDSYSLIENGCGPYTFESLFRSLYCVDASELILPIDATSYCYHFMFYSSSVVNIPTNLTPDNRTLVAPNNSLQGMFQVCSELNCPKLPNWNIYCDGDGACASMFMFSTGIEDASPFVLDYNPNKSHVGTFNGMFNVQAKKYPGITVPPTHIDHSKNLNENTSCNTQYSMMFYGCSRLKRCMTGLAPITSDMTDENAKFKYRYMYGDTGLKINNDDTSGDILLRIVDGYAIPDDSNITQLMFSGCYGDAENNATPRSGTWSCVAR